MAPRFLLHEEKKNKSNTENRDEMFFLQEKQIFFPIKIGENPFVLKMKSRLPFLLVRSQLKNQKETKQATLVELDLFQLTQKNFHVDEY